MRILLLAYLFCGVIGNAQDTAKDSIDKNLRIAVYDILQLAAKNSITAIDTNYIHPHFGVYDVNRIGVADLFQRYESISFAFPPKGQTGTMYPNFTNLDKVNISKELEVYNVFMDCGEVIWDREGLFITDQIIYPKVSEIIEQQEKYDYIVHSDIDKMHCKFIEENSYRVVLTEFDIIFYLTLIDGQWYLTLLDRVTTDCSA